MRPVEYFIAIDFGTANTKVLCWDINKNSTFPMKLGNGRPDGIAPTVVDVPERKGIVINFWGKPKDMNCVGDIPVFQKFVRELYDNILRNAPMLNFETISAEPNFLVVISYPAEWSVDDGKELLSLVKECIPSVQYAIQQEKVALKQLEHSVMIPSIVGSFNASNFTYLTTSAYGFQTFSVNKGLNLDFIDSYLLENAMTAVLNGNTRDLDNKLVELISHDNIVEAELFLRYKKELLMGKKSLGNNSIEEEDKWILDWIEKAEQEFCEKFKLFLQDEKKQITNKRIPIYNETDFEATILLIGGYSDFLDNTIQSVFPSVTIYHNDIFYIAECIIEDIKEIYKEACDSFDSLREEILGEEKEQKFINDSAKMVSEAIKVSYNKSRKEDLFAKLYKFVGRDYRTSLAGFTHDIRNFFSKDITLLFTDDFIGELGIGYSTILSSFINQLFLSKNESNKYQILDIRQYFDFQISPFYYFHDNIRKYMKKPVYTKLFLFFNERKLTLSLDQDDRNKAFDGFKEYLGENYLVNKPALFSWVLLEKNDAWQHYFMDIYCINKDFILTKQTIITEVGLKDLENVINYIFNKLVSVSNTQDVIPFSNAGVKEPLSEEFDFKTYVYIKRLIGDKMIEKPKDDILNSLCINNLDVLSLYINN